MLYTKVLIPKDKRYIHIPRVILKRGASIYFYDPLEIEDVKICIGEVCHAVIENRKSGDLKDLCIKIVVFQKEILIVIEADNLQGWDRLSAQEKKDLEFRMFLVKSLTRTILWQRIGDGGRVVMIKSKEDD